MNNYKNEVDYKVGRPFLIFVLEKVNSLPCVGERELVAKEKDKYVSIQLEADENSITIKEQNGLKIAILKTKAPSTPNLKIELANEIKSLLNDPRSQSP
ncbi:hypothetical protein [Metallosphaera sp.]|uniref:hypothetical protein n=1 Tax=Metallosphaera sp. TaxID=2020860 RepID=UPI003175337C